MSNAALPPTSQEAFNLWAAWRMQGGGEPLSRESAHKYEIVWRCWIRHLSAKQLAWHQARELEVDQFVHGLGPRARHGTLALDASSSLPPARGSRQASTVTRTRYLRALRAIYSYAAIQQWVPFNPAHRAPEDARTEDADSYVPLPAQRVLFRTLLPDGSAWQARRDRALLLVLLDAGLTVAELRELRVGQLHLPSESLAAEQALIVLTGSRLAQNRSVPIGPPCQQALRRWLTLRPSAGPEDLVFISRKGGHLLTAPAVFYVVRTLVTKTLACSGHHGPVPHVGPNVLRNAAIADWLQVEGLDPSAAARRAGLEHVRSLDRILKACGMLQTSRD